MQPNPSLDTSNPEVPNCRVSILYVSAVKLGRRGQLRFIRITGSLTTITDWEGWYDLLKEETGRSAQEYI
jgi:hypothetical protein